MLQDIIKDRLRKLAEYKKFGNPYPATVSREAAIKDVLQQFSKLRRSRKKFSLTGRVMALRDQGKIIFLQLEDGTGRLQFVFSKEKTKNFELLKKTIDVGDFLETTGRLFKTKRGEKSLLGEGARIVSKSLRPLPTAWYGLEDIETRLRERYLDSLLNPTTKEMFVKKNVFWEAVRTYLKKENFLEVEMPVFESVPGGADAEPFITHHNALNEDFYLRISLELPLKKLLVGGYEKVFEIGRIFRNEGIDREHLQDYTQMECYLAYADYKDMMNLVQGLYQSTVKAIFGTTKTKVGGKTVSWSGKWPRVDYYKIFLRETGIDLKKTTISALLTVALKLSLRPEKNLGKGRLIDLIFKKAVRPKIWQPIFLVNPPIEISPLAKRMASDPGRAERFQIMAAHTEVGNGFSELNDPIEQRARFEEQMKLRALGDKEAQMLDEEFLTALEYGMPPAAGFGMSERLFAVLMDKPIRETVFFPLMRREK